MTYLSQNISYMLRSCDRSFKSERIRKNFRSRPMVSVFQDYTPGQQYEGIWNAYPWFRSHATANPVKYEGRPGPNCFLLSTMNTPNYSQAYFPVSGTKDFDCSSPKSETCMPSGTGITRKAGHIPYKIFEKLCNCFHILRSRPVSRHTSTDNVYKACRLTAEVSILAFTESGTWLEAAKGTLIPTSVQDALSKTNLGDLWGEQIDLLYWILLIMQCASWGTPNYVFFHRVLPRIFYELTYDLDDWHGGIVPMIELHCVSQACQSTVRAESC
jgi:hypothetical protein